MNSLSIVNPIFAPSSMDDGVFYDTAKTYELKATIDELAVYQRKVKQLNRRKNSLIEDLYRSFNGDFETPSLVVKKISVTGSIDVNALLSDLQVDERLVDKHRKNGYMRNHVEIK